MHKSAQLQHVFPRQLPGHLTAPAPILQLSNTNTQLKGLIGNSLFPSPAFSNVSWYLVHTQVLPHAQEDLALLNLTCCHFLFSDVSPILATFCSPVPSAFLMHVLSVCNILFCPTGFSLYSKSFKSGLPSDPMGAWTEIFYSQRLLMNLQSLVLSARHWPAVKQQHYSLASALACRTHDTQHVVKPVLLHESWHRTEARPWEGLTSNMYKYLTPWIMLITDPATGKMWNQSKRAFTYYNALDKHHLHCFGLCYLEWMNKVKDLQGEFPTGM